jgi:hypothetical protein
VTSRTTLRLCRLCRRHAVVAPTVWIGVLAGVLAGLQLHVRGSPALPTIAAPRFGMVALGCYVAVGAAGITVAWVNLRFHGDLWGTRQQGHARVRSPAATEGRHL